MNVNPTDWPEAAIYFTDYEGGYFDEFSQAQLLYTHQEVRQSGDTSRLYVGRPGVDGIEFVYRKDLPGLWAWYPIPGQYAKLAETLPELIDGWILNKIKV